MLLVSQVVTGCGKPRYFSERGQLFEVHTATGMLYNTEGGSPMIPIGEEDLPTPILVRHEWVWEAISVSCKHAICIPACKISRNPRVCADGPPAVACPLNTQYPVNTRTIRVRPGEKGAPSFMSIRVRTGKFLIMSKSMIVRARRVTSDERRSSGSFAWLLNE